MSAGPIDPTREHLRGSALLVAGRAIGILLNFATQVVVVQYLAKSDYGVFAYAISVSVVLSVLAAFGTDKAASRFLPGYLESGDAAMFWGFLRLGGLTITATGLTAIGVFAAAYAFGVPLLSDDPSTQRILVIVAVLAVLNAFDALVMAVFAVLASPKAIFLRRSVLAPVLRLGAALLVIAAGWSITALALGQVAAAAIGLAVCWPLFVRISARRPELAIVDPSDRRRMPVRELYGYSGTILAGDLSFVIRTALVSVVLGLAHSSEEVARYDAVLPLARLNEVVVITFAVLLVPNAARLAAAGDRAEMQTLLERSAMWVSALSYPIFAVLLAASDTLPTFLFGDEYEASSSVLAILTFGFFLNASFGTTIRFIRAAGTLTTLLRADLIQLVLAVAMIAILVPPFGAVGGAVAVTCTFVGQAIVYTQLVESRLGLRAWAPLLRTSIVMSSIGVAVAVAARALDVGLAGSAGLALVSWPAVLWLHRASLDVASTFPELARVTNRPRPERVDNR